MDAVRQTHSVKKSGNCGEEEHQPEIQKQPAIRGNRGEEEEQPEIQKQPAIRGSRGEEEEEH